MAKKAKEMSVEDKLKTLFRLQEVLSGIDEKRALRGELPLEVEDLEDEVAGLATRIEKITRDIDELNQAVVQKGEEIKLAKESVERYKDQLNSRTIHRNSPFPSRPMRRAIPFDCVRSIQPQLVSSQN